MVRIGHSSVHWIQNKKTLIQIFKVSKITELFFDYKKFWGNSFNNFQIPAG